MTLISEVPPADLLDDTTAAHRWTSICRFERLEPERGVAALLDGVQVALIRTHAGEVHAVANRDPVTRAPVMSRGIVGSRGDRPTLASPLHKEVYDLTTGRRLDGDGPALAVHQVRMHDDLIQVRLIHRATPGRS